MDNDFLRGSIEFKAEIFGLIPGTISVHEFTILLYLCAYSQSENPHTSRCLISKNLKMSKRTVMHAINKLIGLGYLTERIRGFKDGTVQYARSYFQVTTELMKPIKGDSIE